MRKTAALLSVWCAMVVFCSDTAYALMAVANVPREAVVGGSVRMSVSIREEWGIKWARWDLGNGMVASGQSIECVYPESGSFSVKVDVIATHYVDDGSGHGGRIEEEETSAVALIRIVPCAQVFLVPNEIDQGNFAKVVINMVTDSGELYRMYSGKVTLEIGDPGIAEAVSPWVEVENGVGIGEISGKSPGTTTVSCRADDISPYHSYGAELRVLEGKVEDVEVTIEGPTECIVNEPVEYTVIVPEGWEVKSLEWRIKPGGSQHDALTVEHIFSKIGYYVIGITGILHNKDRSCSCEVAKDFNTIVYDVLVDGIDVVDPHSAKIYCSTNPAGVAVPAIDCFLNGVIIGSYENCSGDFYFAFDLDSLKYGTNSAILRISSNGLRFEKSVSLTKIQYSEHRLGGGIAKVGIEVEGGFAIVTVPFYHNLYEWWDEISCSVKFHKENNLVCLKKSYVNLETSAVDGPIPTEIDTWSERHYYLIEGQETLSQRMSVTNDDTLPMQNAHYQCAECFSNGYLGKDSKVDGVAQILEISFYDDAGPVFPFVVLPTATKCKIK